MTRWSVSPHLNNYPTKIVRNIKYNICNIKKCHSRGQSGSLWTAYRFLMLLYTSSTNFFYKESKNVNHFSRNIYLKNNIELWSYFSPFNSEETQSSIFSVMQQNRDFQACIHDTRLVAEICRHDRIISFLKLRENMHDAMNFRWFYKNTRLPVTRWVKLSLNFELLVPK